MREGDDREDDGDDFDTMLERAWQRSEDEDED